jgi:hypothetical protein
MKEVFQWLQSENKDYNKGVELLAAHCSNKFLVNTFQKSSAQFSMDKLIVELKKVIGMPIADIAMNKPIPVMNFGIESTLIKEVKIITDPVDPPTGPIQTLGIEIPKIIKDAKEIYSGLRNKIREIDNTLFNLGTSNDSDICDQRSKLIVERTPLIELSDKIYVLKEEYFVTKIIPADLEELLKIAIGEKKAEEPKDLTIEEKIKAMTDLELHNRKRNIVTQITKYRNQLSFQSNKKEQKENPMPAGEKRTEIEGNIERLTKEMDLVNSEIEKRKK